MPPKAKPAAAEPGGTSADPAVQLQQASFVRSALEATNVSLKARLAELGKEQLVLRDIETGAELARVDSGSPLQSPVFPAAGPHRCVYQCTFSTLSALRW